MALPLKQISDDTLDLVYQAHTVQIQGKKFITSTGLLLLAHSYGIKSIETELLHLPQDDNGVVVVRAKVVDKDGNVWSALGDASNQNTNKAIAVHKVRMAETRAVARALRRMLGIDMVSYEELVDGGADEHVSSTPVAEQVISRKQSTQKQVSTQTQQTGKVVNMPQKDDAKQRFYQQSKRLQELFHILGVTKEEAQSTSQQLFGKKSFVELTDEERELLIAFYEKRLQQQQQQNQGGIDDQPQQTQQTIEPDIDILENLDDLKLE